MARSITWLLLVFMVAACDKEDAAKDTLADLKPEVTYQGKRLSDWTKQLESDDVSDRRMAAKAIQEMGQRALEALPALESVLGKPDEDGVVRFVAAVSIWQMTQQAQNVMPALLSMLRSNDVEIQYRGALALEIIGPGAMAAVPVLENIVETYKKLDYSRLSYDEQLLLATAKDALAKIEGRD